MRRVTFLYYWLAGLGAAGFILSFPLHSRFAFVGGVCLIAFASLIAAVCYVVDRDPQTRPQNLVGAAFAVLFAAWCLAWLVVPALHVRWITLIVVLNSVARRANCSGRLSAGYDVARCRARSVPRSSNRTGAMSICTVILRRRRRAIKRPRCRAVSINAAGIPCGASGCWWPRPARRARFCRSAPTVRSAHPGPVTRPRFPRRDSTPRSLKIAFPPWCRRLRLAGRVRWWSTPMSTRAPFPRSPIPGWPGWPRSGVIAIASSRPAAEFATSSSSRTVVSMWASPCTIPTGRFMRTRSSRRWRRRNCVGRLADVCCAGLSATSGRGVVGS